MRKHKSPPTGPPRGDSEDLLQPVGEAILESMCGTECGFPLREVLQNLCKLSALVWTHGKVLHDFTDHGIGHSKRILGYLRRLSDLLPAQQRLSDAEWFVLITAALVHDFGMQWPFILRELAPQASPGVGDDAWQVTRSHHVTRSCELLSSVVNGRPPYSGMAPALAYFGAGESHEWDKLLSWTLTAIGAHSRDSSGQEEVWRQAQAWRDFPPNGGAGLAALGRFRMPLVASLFRLADELDITHERVPSLRRLLAQRPNVPVPSLVYWAACYFVDHVQISNSGVKLFIDETKLPQDAPLAEFGSFLVRNLINDKLRRSFLKSVTRDTLSIQNTLLLNGLPLFYAAPGTVGGRATPQEAEKSEGFLNALLNGLRAVSFTGTVPFRAYSIRGNTQTGGVDPGLEMRRVLVIDETSETLVPSVLKPGFLATQNLQGSRALVFLCPAKGYDAEVVAFSERGQRIAPSPSAILAGAAHLDRAAVDLLSGGEAHHVRHVRGSTAMTINRTTKPVLRKKAMAGCELHSEGHTWQKVQILYAGRNRKPQVATVHVIGLAGVHCIVWPPENDANPILRNMLEGPIDGSPGRERWLERTQVFEDVARRILVRLGIPAATLSVMAETPPYPVLTYSSESDSCVTFSGGGIAAAGAFALDSPVALHSVESVMQDSDTVDVASWYDPSQRYRVVRKNRSIELCCSVRHVVDGRFFL